MPWRCQDRAIGLGCLTAEFFPLPSSKAMLILALKSDQRIFQ
jgi:hypothetical protein